MPQSVHKSTSCTCTLHVHAPYTCMHLTRTCTLHVHAPYTSMHLTRTCTLHVHACRSREIEADYIGRLRHVRPLSECLCKAPHGFTALMANSSLTCVTDVPDQHGITATSARLAAPGYGRESHFVPEFVNDGNSSTAWASGTSHSRDTVDIQVDFASPVQVRHGKDRETIQSCLKQNVLNIYVCVFVRASMRVYVCSCECVCVCAHACVS